MTASGRAITWNEYHDPETEGRGVQRLQPPARLMLGKSGDDRDFKSGEHISSRAAVGGAEEAVGCSRNRHWEKTVWLC